MAGASHTSSSAQAQVYRASGAILSAEMRFMGLSLVGDSPRSIIVTEKSAGQKRGSIEIMTFQPWTAAPMGKGRGKQVWGNESTSSKLNDSFIIQYQVLGDGAIENEVSDQNEVEFSLRESEEIRAAHDCATLLETSFWHQLAGYTPVNDLTAGGPLGSGYSDGTTTYMNSCHNACVEPDASHHFYAPGAAVNTTEAAVAADPQAKVTSRLVNSCIRKLTTDKYGNLYPLPPAMTPWGEGYLCILDGEGMESVRENSSESDVWELSMAMIQSGLDPQDAPIWPNTAFKIGNVFYLQTDFLPLGTTNATANSVTSSAPLANCARGLILGPRAAHIRWGDGFSREKWLGYKSEVFQRRFGLMMDTVFGMSVCIPGKVTAPGGAVTVPTTAQRFGSAVLSYYTDATTARYD